MKKNRFKILTVACVVGANLIFSSCVDNLLNQTPGGELASSLYWKTESDAESRLCVRWKYGISEIQR